MTDETSTPDYHKMPFEELLMMGNNEKKSNPPLFEAIMDRRQILDLASACSLDETDRWVKDINNRLEALEAKFERLLKLIDRQSDAMKVRITVEEFVKGIIK